MVNKHLLLPAMIDMKHIEVMQQKYDGVDLDDDGGDRAEKMLEGFEPPHYYHCQCSPFIN
jgi:hypothetical protein